MNTAERLYQVTKELPEPLLSELLLFAEFLLQRTLSEGRQTGNIAQRIHQRFANLEGEGLPIPAAPVIAQAAPMGSLMEQSILLDTNVLSELMRPQPDAQALAWFNLKPRNVKDFAGIPGLILINPWEAV